MSKPMEEMQEMMTLAKEYKAELDAMKAEKKAQEAIKKADEVAAEKAKKIVDGEIAESEMIKEYIDQQTKMNIDKLRDEKKHFYIPEGNRVGNMPKAHKQMLDIAMGRKVMNNFDMNGKTVFLASGGAGNAGEWMPLELAQEIQRSKEEVNGVRRALRVINAPSDPFKVPTNVGPALVSAPAEGVAITENTTDFIANVTLTHKKLAALVPYSNEAEEDAVAAIVPEMIWSMAQGLANNEDEFFLHGSINDGTPVSGTGLIGFGGTAIQAGATGTTTTGAQWDAAFTNASAAMAQYAYNPAETRLIVGTNVYYRVLMNHPDLRTLEQYGDRAVIFTGEVARFRGVPVFLSQGIRSLPDTLPDTQESALYINTRAALLSDRRMLTVKRWEDIKLDVNYINATIRVAYAGLFAQGVKVINCHFDN